MLSPLAHAEEPGVVDIAAAALETVAVLDEERATLYYDLILGSLPEIMAEALEQMMVSRKYEYRSSFAKRYFSEGREEGREGLRLAVRGLVTARLGSVPGEIEHVLAAANAATLIGWIEALDPTRDEASVRHIFGLRKD